MSWCFLMFPWKNGLREPKVLQDTETFFNWFNWFSLYRTTVTCPYPVNKASCPLTLIWLRFWANAESVCFLLCFPYRLGPESGGSMWLVCLAWELRVILLTEAWEVFLSQLDLDLFIPTPVGENNTQIKLQWLFMSCNSNFFPLSYLYEICLCTDSTMDIFFKEAIHKLVFFPMHVFLSIHIFFC